MYSNLGEIIMVLTEDGWITNPLTPAELEWLNKEDERLKLAIEEEFKVPYEEMRCYRGTLNMTKEE